MPESVEHPCDGQTLLLDHAVLISIAESFRLMYSTGHSSLFTTCDKTATSSLSNASVCRTKGREKLGECNSGPQHKTTFTWQKACLHSSIYCNRCGAPFLVKSVGLGFRAGCSHCCLITLGIHLPMAHVKTQVLYFYPSNCTLLLNYCESYLSQEQLSSVVNGATNHVI